MSLPFIYTCDSTQIENSTYINFYTFLRSIALLDDDDILTKQQPNQEAEKKKKLINQFNYCERAVLTLNNPPRNVETQTIPPPRSTFGSYVLQWIIYDSYAEDFEQTEREKEKERKV